MWELIAGGAVKGLLGNILSGQRQMARINNRLADNIADTNNKLRRANALEVTAKNNVARYMQSLNNQRTMDAAGDALAANTVNAARAVDMYTRRGLAESIKDSEQAGSAAAAQAAAGVGGNVVDTINQATSLRAAIVRQAAATEQSAVLHDSGQRAGSIVSQMVGGIDSSAVLDAIDYTQSVAQHQYGGPSHLQAMFSGAMDAAVNVGLQNLGGLMSKGSKPQTTGDFARFDRGQAPMPESSTSRFSWKLPTFNLFGK